MITKSILVFSALAPCIHRSPWLLYSVNRYKHKITAPATRQKEFTVITRTFVNATLLGALFLVASARSAVELSPERVDLGQVDENTVTDSVFYLRNTGPETVTIKQIRPTCGCTKADKVSGTLSPGDSMAIRFSFSSLGFSGKVNKDIIVVYEQDGRLKRTTFTYRANVKNALTLTPRRSRFRGLKANVTLSVRNVTDDTIHITGANFPERHVFATSAKELVGTALPPQQTIKLPLSMRYNPSVNEVKYTWVKLKTDARLTPELRHFLYPSAFPIRLVVIAIAAVVAATVALVVLVRRRYKKNPPEPVSD
ncbi:MAG: DUF1573 domain-containing protein [Chitinivibrionales bacterium]|nr:DUF1573 domain-containing protein [Chitinivibrionales bacterium]MBD3355736.1 DUF1573 domain-containing protein [Chitinivibrionales bacterium]